eukprot:TRINITY_DN119_c4_g1_i1.p1 TRINITY_DN119_c4_g1~~TRINITY_DN119_c4_g1_i1.p1  ORF type:complete len:194 (-),score=91.43 TRINITY_DN119_c4_g1_i1:96-677(-)
MAKVQSYGTTSQTENTSSLNDDDEEEEINSHHHHHNLNLEGKAYVPYILAVVLSIHSFFEGIALGVQTDVTETILIFIAITSHKAVEAFAFGISFVKEDIPIKRWVGVLLIYAGMTPLGIGIGMILVSTTSDRALNYCQGIVEGLAGGTFMYVATIDMLGDELENPGPLKKRLSVLFMFIVGAAIMCGVAYIH